MMNHIVSEVSRLLLFEALFSLSSLYNGDIVELFEPTYIKEKVAFHEFWLRTKSLRNQRLSRLLLTQLRFFLPEQGAIEVEIQHQYSLWVISETLRFEFIRPFIWGLGIAGPASFHWRIANEGKL